MGLSSDPESDAYIDQILANLATVIIENGLDPATLPDADTRFSDTILGITFHGSAHLFNGRFWRLSTIHRTGDTSFTVDGTKVRLTANIGVDAMKWRDPFMTPYAWSSELWKAKMWSLAVVLSKLLC